MGTDDEAMEQWIEEAARRLDLEAEPAEAAYPDVESLLRGGGPALIRLRYDSLPSFLALIGGRGRRLMLLAPDGNIHRLPVDDLHRAVCKGIEQPVAAEVEALLSQTGVTGRSRARAIRSMLAERLGGVRLDGVWLIRPAPGARFAQHLRGAYLSRDGILLAASHLLQYILWLGTWWVIGKGALEGRVDMGWLIAWCLILLTIIPLRMFETWLQGRISITAGAILKQRLLNGALNLEPDETRHLGSGQLLGRVIESEAIEGLALGGGFLGVVSIIELILAMVVLSAGAGGILHVILLPLWTLVAVMIGRRYYIRRLEWTEGRLDITHTLVERMLGHRTRLAQERPGRWHRDEDREVEEYLERSKRMDGTAALLEGVIPRGWILLGLLGITPAFVAQSDPGPLAIAIGGILLASMAFGKFVGGVANLTGAAVAWRQVSFLFNAASREKSAPSILISGIAMGPSDARGNDSALLEASDLVFRYRDQGDPVLRGCGMTMHRGDKILLEGESGGGKSTLASLLVGLREPASGLLLLHGFDRKSVGLEAWRRKIVAAPQFHENHVLMGTFAFNLLMGRRWPPKEEDLIEAETICRELGLGELLDRMPAGLMQNVGETGWQLSHGERSRLFIARALLQKAELIVLDESFGALDPETLQLALACVFRRAPSLLVIAHP